jgi:hypothetical protein
MQGNNGDEGDIAPPVAALIEEFSKLPGLAKTAQRLTFFVLSQPCRSGSPPAEAILRQRKYCVLLALLQYNETDPVLPVAILIAIKSRRCCRRALDVLA